MQNTATTTILSSASARKPRRLPKLSHPNIVNIYDVGYDENVHYIVMEFVRGETLKEYIEKHGHLPINTSIQIAFDIGEALENAHANGIVHCDIKPHNILVTETGRIKVADFGIARAVNSVENSDRTVLGSVHYFHRNRPVAAISTNGRIFIP